MSKATRAILVVFAAVAALAVVVKLRGRAPRAKTPMLPQPDLLSAARGAARLPTQRLVEPPQLSEKAFDPEATEPLEHTGPGRRRKLVGLAITVVLIATWFVFLRPSFLGGPAAYVLVSGNSMLPTLEDGDFVVAIRQERYEAGDIAVYKIPEDDVGGGGRVIHRIVGGSAQEGYLLRGDNRETNDLWRPTPADIEGELWLRIPGAGRAVPILRSPLIMALFAGVMAFLFIYRWNSDDDEEVEEKTVAAGG